MKFTLTVVALFSVLGRADAALRNSNAPVITSSNEGESSHDTPKPAEDTHSFLSENGSSTTACDDKCVGGPFGGVACVGVDQSKIGCGSCLGSKACEGYNGDSIGENSCRVAGSCFKATAIIGNNSCNARDACFGATGYIPDNQCNSDNECKGKHFPAPNEPSADFPELSLYKAALAGGCRSSLGEQFSHVSIASNWPNDSPEACAQFCRQPSLTNGFQVGMQFGKSECFCLYDGIGELPSLVPSGAVKRTTEGYGHVASGSLNPSLKCYPLKDVNMVHHSLNEPTLTID